MNSKKTKTTLACYTLALIGLLCFENPATLLAADVPAAKPGTTTIFDFETDLAGWGNGWKVPYLLNSELSDEQKLDGKKSLKVTFENTTGSNQGANLVLENPPTLKGGDTITVHYWLPRDSGVNVLQPAVQTEKVPFTGQYTDNLVKGEWGEIKLKVPDDSGSIKNVHIQIWLPPGVKGVAYFDSISW